MRNHALAPERIAAVETGGCPHTAVRDDISQNLEALHRLMEQLQPELLFVESGGDNLAAQFSRDLADYTIYVIDVSGGDKIPRKGGPGITQSDLLVINKTDLAPLVGADLAVMERDAKKMRGDGPFLFTQVTNGVGVDEVIEHVLEGVDAVVRRSAESAVRREPLRRQLGEQSWTGVSLVAAISAHVASQGVRTGPLRPRADPADRGPRTAIAVTPAPPLCPRFGRLRPAAP